jgi:serine/threonine protein kinase
VALSRDQTLQNRYRIIRLIGQGGFAAVYRAWDISLNRSCAVKENLDASAEAQRQFQKEASLLAALDHPNLPRVTDHFFIPGLGQYLVMDFIEGQSLEDRLKQKGAPLTQEETLPWIEQVCSALTYLHSRIPPIIHRDIKPANIIITPADQAILVDFGISKVYNTNLRTTVGAKAVTPGYSPPEQYGSGNTNARTDIYAIGATLYCLLTGQDPPESVERVVGNAIMVAPCRLNNQISSDVEIVILKATAIDIQKRFQTIEELHQAIQKAASNFILQPLQFTVTPSQPQSVATLKTTQILKTTPVQVQMALVVIAGIVFVACCLSIFVVSEPTSNSVALLPTRFPTARAPVVPSTYTPEIHATLRPTFTRRPANTPAPTPTKSQSVVVVATRQPSIPPTSLPVSAGDTIIVDGWQVQVERIVITDRTTGISGNVERAAGRFALIFMRVTNLGLSKDVFIAFGSLEVKDAEGRLFEENHLASAYAAYEHDTEGAVYINPDETGHMLAAFDISLSSDYYQLVPGSLAQTATGTILLNIP